MLRTTFQLLFPMIILSACNQRTTEEQIVNTHLNEENIQSIEVSEGSAIDKKIGESLFKSITDTLTIKPISTSILVSNQWIYKPFDDCESLLTFKLQEKGSSYNCEMELTAEISYKIEKDKVLITEYDIVVENELQLKKIKVREDTYAYNGKCLLLIDSKMYNIRGDAWIPEIEDVISYHMKK